MKMVNHVISIKISEEYLTYIDRIQRDENLPSRNAVFKFLIDYYVEDNYKGVLNYEISVEDLRQLISSFRTIIRKVDKNEKEL